MADGYDEHGFKLQDKPARWFDAEAVTPAEFREWEHCAERPIRLVRAGEHIRAGQKLTGFEDRGTTYCLTLEQGRDLYARLGTAIRFIESEACTGVSASWCPVHGDCACQKDEVSGEVVVRLFYAGTEREYDALEYVTSGRLEITWPEGGTHGWTPWEYAPGEAIAHLGLEKRAPGMLGCPLHSPTSSHADFGLAELAEKTPTPEPA